MGGARRQPRRRPLTHQWRDLPVFLGNWSIVCERYRDRAKAMLSCGFSRSVATGRTWRASWVATTIPGASPWTAVHRQGQGAKGGPGARHRSDAVALPLLHGLHFAALIADLDARGAKIVIAQHQRPTRPPSLDAKMYQWRHPIENSFCKLKEFRSIATRADATDHSCNATIHLAAAVIDSR